MQSFQIKTKCSLFAMCNHSQVLAQSLSHQFWKKTTEAMMPFPVLSTKLAADHSTESLHPSMVFTELCHTLSYQEYPNASAGHVMPTGTKLWGQNPKTRCSRPVAERLWSLRQWRELPRATHGPSGLVWQWATRKWRCHMDNVVHTTARGGSWRTGRPPVPPLAATWWIPPTWVMWWMTHTGTSPSYHSTHWSSQPPTTCVHVLSVMFMNIKCINKTLRQKAVVIQCEKNEMGHKEHVTSSVAPNLPLHLCDLSLLICAEASNGCVLVINTLPTHIKLSATHWGVHIQAIIWTKRNHEFKKLQGL